MFYSIQIYNINKAFKKKTVPSPRSIKIIGRSALKKIEEELRPFTSPPQFKHYVE